MKYALVTGVTKGIGKTIAKTLHDKGYYVYGVYKWHENYTDEEHLAELITKELTNLKIIPCDLKERESFNKIAQVLGDAKLDAVVHNAGEFLENSWNEFNIEAWDRSIKVNMEAPLLLTKKIEKNLKSGAGIVAITSTDGWHAGFGDVGYAVSKAGLNNVVKTMAAALAYKGIRVNAVVVSWADTQMAENANINELAHDKALLGRNATTQEIANVVEFLLSDKASYLTGSLVVTDGGYTSVDYVVKKEFEKQQDKTKSL